MNHIKDIIQSRIAPKQKSERAEILEEIRQKINKERVGTKQK